MNRRPRRPKWQGRECQDCAAPIVFAILDTGSRIPLDPLPTDDGNVCARMIGADLHGYVIAKQKPAKLGWARFTPHAATCPERKPAVKPPLPPGLFALLGVLAASGLVALGVAAGQGMSPATTGSPTTVPTTQPGPTLPGANR